MHIYDKTVKSCQKINGKAQTEINYTEYDVFLSFLQDMNHVCSPQADILLEGEEGAPCCKHLWCYLLQIVVHSSPSAINFLHHQIATFHRGPWYKLKEESYQKISKNVYSHLTVESGGQTQESNQEKQLSCFAISLSLS